MLSVREVSFSYGAGRAAQRVLDRVSLEVDRGTIVGLLGPNGSGKTTLIRLIAGMLRPTAGSITLGGQLVSSMARRHLARRLAVVPQETQTTFDFSVIDMVLM